VAADCVLSVCLSVCMYAYARAVGFKLRSLLLTACTDFIFIRALKFVSFWGEGFWFQKQKYKRQLAG
jgi:hypothetical protein